MSYCFAFLPLKNLRLCIQSYSNGTGRIYQSSWILLVSTRFLCSCVWVGWFQLSRLVMGEIPACQAKTYKSRSKVHQNCLKICTKFKIQAQKPLFSNRWFLWRLRFAGLYSDISLTRLHCRAVTWQTMQGREREETQSEESVTKPVAWHVV